MASASGVVVTFKTQSETNRAKGTWNGMNWIRQEKRLAIYLRDGLTCAWCGAQRELSLDHVIPAIAGGSNREDNLVTCCSTCNSSRQDRPAEQWAAIVAAYRGQPHTAEALLGHVNTLRVTKLNKTAALELKRQYGSCAKAIAALQG